MLGTPKGGQTRLALFLCKKTEQSKKFDVQFSKKSFFLVCTKKLVECFKQQMLKKHISSSIWNAQHPNTDENKQQSSVNNSKCIS